MAVLCFIVGHLGTVVALTVGVCRTNSILRDDCASHMFAIVCILLHHIISLQHFRGAMSSMGLRLKVLDEEEQRRFLVPVPKSVVLVADLVKHVHRRSNSEESLVCKACCFLNLLNCQIDFHGSRICCKKEWQGGPEGQRLCTFAYATCPGRAA